MAVETFKKYIEDNGVVNIEVLISDEATHTAQQAADVHGVPVSNIVKSLLTCGAGGFYLILVPGDKRLDLDIWKAKLDESELRMANADEVKSMTGYSIGGVPPFGHYQKLKTFIDDGFDKSTQLVAAAGSANSVFKIDYDYLARLVS